MTTRTVDLDLYAGWQMYVGDIHNHCGISYGHGSIEDAWANARLQLDFASVTGHAWWHDMPDNPESAATADYHRRGFERLADCWEHVQDVTAEVHEDGRFVSLLSFEWHSRTYGDHCVYYKGARGPIIRANSLEELRDELRALRATGLEAMALPHHIGYQQGRRGANWDTFSPELSPVVELMSMHGCGESDDAPRPYLHTMGPRHTASTAMHGLQRGHRFGFIGSTDHHSAHPGSFGHGRIAVWADELTRDGIWSAIRQRRTYALTGDPIVVGFEVNGVPMGGAAPASPNRRIRAEVRAEAPLDYIEVVRNGVPLYRRSRQDLPHADGGGPFRGTVPFSVGWGDIGQETHWDVTLEVVGGRLLDVVPRLRGEDIVMPTDDAPNSYHFSSWDRPGEQTVVMRTRTQGNANVVTDGTQGLNLHVEGDDRTRILANVNGVETVHHLRDLRTGSADTHLSDFLSPVYRFGRAVGEQELTASIDFEDVSDGADWYHLRVRQLNDQWAWSSPVWIDAPEESGWT